ncbi:hypothetical protein SAMN05216276_103373 [Streptosporangium subroseum]|uniref:Uncharacterized protein n=1 Tax=Streptosporangium subroseum TaxID=106412 RepID=A0A239LLY9_9ACTN|nr:hypothetical protein SAMN05216276_103373 [Streptosporangium subroseum]
MTAPALPAITPERTAPLGTRRPPSTGIHRG